MHIGSCWCFTHAWFPVWCWVVGPRVHPKQTRGRGMVVGSVDGPGSGAARTIRPSTVVTEYRDHLSLVFVQARVFPLRAGKKNCGSVRDYLSLARKGEEDGGALLPDGSLCGNEIGTSGVASRTL